MRDDIVGMPATGERGRERVGINYGYSIVLSRDPLWEGRRGSCEKRMNGRGKRKREIC
jgi:hypothetical protein